MRFPRRRGTPLIPRGRLIKMSQERQKLSFFIVVIFLAVFGIIILAEVLSMEEGKNGGGGYGISYEHDARAANLRQSLAEEEVWETAKPLLQSKIGTYAPTNSFSFVQDPMIQHIYKRQINLTVPKIEALNLLKLQTALFSV